MTWFVAVSGVVLAIWAVLGLVRMAAPATEEERRADDEAQMRALASHRAKSIQNQSRRRALSLIRHVMARRTG